MMGALPPLNPHEGFFSCKLWVIWTFPLPTLIITHSRDKRTPSNACIQFTPAQSSINVYSTRFHYFVKPPPTGVVFQSSQSLVIYTAILTTGGQWKHRGRLTLRYCSSTCFGDWDFSAASWRPNPMLIW